MQKVARKQVANSPAGILDGSNFKIIMGRLNDSKLFLTPGFSKNKEKNIFSTCRCISVKY